MWRNNKHMYCRCSEFENRPCTYDVTKVQVLNLKSRHLNYDLGGSQTFQPRRHLLLMVNDKKE